MDLGIIGLARSGKSSLFNTVTGGHAGTGAYSSRQRPNLGVVHVPDARLDALAQVFKPKKTTFAETRWVDYPAGPFESRGPGESSGPSAQFLAELAGMDALVHIVRAFEDEAAPHPEGSGRCATGHRVAEPRIDGRGSGADRAAAGEARDGAALASGERAPGAGA